MITPLAGSVTMGVSSAGNSYAEARRNGYSDDQALAYGILNGVSESAMQYLLGGIGKLGKGGVSTAVSKIPGFSSALTKINNVTSKLALNPKVVNALKTAGKIAADANDEGIEEYLQATIDPIFRNVILGENNEIKAFSEEQLYSYLLGALTSVGMNAATGEYRNIVLPDGKTVQVQVDENGNPVETSQNIAQSTSSESNVISPIAAENAPVNGTEAGRAVIAPVRVGQNTVIQSPYNGQTPVYTKPANNTVPIVQADSLATASQQIASAKNQQSQSGKSFRNYLKSFYNSVFERTGGVREVTVNGLDFGGQPYVVTVNKNTVGKVVSDPNVTAEKLALFDILNDVIQNGEYVGSGSYTPHGSRTKNVTRYDYFETPVQIGGKDYLASFDVEVIPGHNNYRTHKVINKIDLTSIADGEAGPVPAASAAGVDDGNLHAAPTQRSSLFTPIIPNSSQKSNRVFAPGITSTVENGKTISWSETQKDGVTNPAKAFEEKWGIKTSVVKPDGKTSASAFLKDGMVYLNADKVNTFYGALSKIAHEATHAVENTPAWNEIKKAAAAYYRAVDPNLRPSVMREAVRERYKGVAELTGDQAAAEVVAGFIEDICAQDSKVGERASRILLEKSPNGFKRVTQFLREKVESLKAYMPVGTGLSRQQRYELQAAQRGLRRLEKALKAYRKGKVEVNRITDIKYSLDVSFSEATKKIEKGTLKRSENSFILVSKNTPKIFLTEDVGAQNRPVVISYESLYLAVRNSGELQGHYHSIGSNLMSKLPEILNDPELILRLKNGRLNAIVELPTFKGDKSVVSIELEAIKDINKSYKAYNLIVTVFGARENYINNLLNNPNNIVVYKKGDSSQVNPRLNKLSGIINEESSNTTIAPNAEGVNNSISETSKNDTPYSYGEGSFTDYYLDYANRRYGTIPQGENDYREVSVPRQTGEGTKTRRAARPSART